MSIMGFQSRVASPARGLCDAFGRKIDYLRVSVTDRCNFRCLYCMSEDVTFLPRREVLSYDEMDRLCSAFIALGVRRLRLTGGEPLVRRDIVTLVRSLSRHLDSGALDEITMTTNGALLARHAADLKAAGIRRINVSCDTLDPQVFRAISRRGDLARVLDGMEAALAAGLAVKINAVAMRGVNDGELDRLILYAHGRGMDVTVIETMPIGAVDGDRSSLFLPLSEVRTRLAQRFTLIDTDERTAGPSRYVRLAETGGRVGFVSPLSHGFCGSCNRARLTCTGQLALCLGQDLFIDLKTPLKASESDGPLYQAIEQAMMEKPQGHHFAEGHLKVPAVLHAMGMTGG
jgi:cyclic pyranopterin phosphate synthase